MKILKLCAVAISAVFILYGCSGTNPTNVAQNATVSNVPTNVHSSETPDEVAMGTKLYHDNCAKCHKDDGTGGKVTVDGKQLEPDNLTDKKIVAFSDEKITKYIKTGVEDEGMPAFKDKLTDDQIKEVVRHIRQNLQKVPAQPASSPAT
ncbi:MAG TPA: cytochrome c [Pyrinomonadaceae bacterium]|jgi:mono/diheme cytochrome c family protein|nr:cytochrome c [Pyrinomonadaceae bacterium]